MNNYKIGTEEGSVLSLAKTNGGGSNGSNDNKSSQERPKQKPENGGSDKNKLPTYRDIGGGLKKR